MAELAVVLAASGGCGLFWNGSTGIPVTDLWCRCRQSIRRIRGGEIYDRAPNIALIASVVGAKVVPGLLVLFPQPARSLFAQVDDSKIPAGAHRNADGSPDPQLVAYPVSLHLCLHRRGQK